MTQDEYNLLFHKEQLNLVAFKRLMDCDEEVLRLVNSAIKAEREACAKVCAEMQEKAEEYGTECCKWPTPSDCAYAIRARGDKNE
jgi:hypothetical protein